MKASLIIGTRPQIIKSWSIVNEAKKQGLDLEICHTGQHESYTMALQFYNELNFHPHYHLTLNQENTGLYQLGEMLFKLTNYVEHSKPDIIIVPGDTRSALAASIVARYKKIPLVHVEAGTRSGIMIEEEMNRILIDKMADLLTCPTQNARDNLVNERINTPLIVSGDTHFDTWLNFKDEINRCSWNHPRGYELLTLHRQENLVYEKFMEIIQTIGTKGKRMYWPHHPHLDKKLKEWNLDITNVEHLQPLGYIESLRWIREADHVYTDSGGVQREAYWFKKPCTVLREKHEWPETDNDLGNQQFGDGHAGKNIIERILQEYS